MSKPILFASAGTISSVLVSADPSKRRYAETMDELNNMMNNRGFDQEERRNLRMFFMSEANKHETQAEWTLLERMSPQLRARICGWVLQSAHRTAFGTFIYTE